ncbi:MAG TPA: GNAT family N-acetyltransferase [Solirubrobacterales bacterium]|nr:GNAT family N-acetyltransferase [Solirubrobacterales bacterium]
MADGKTRGGVEFEHAALDRVEKRFWRDIWESVPAEVGAERGVGLRDFGPVQASVVNALPGVGMMNLVLGATEPGAVADGHLAAAAEWVASCGVASYVPVSPGQPETESAERWLAANGFSRAYAWMKFARDAHPPRFAVPGDVEVIEVTDAKQAPFGMIAATGFGLPVWGAAFFADLPGREGWRCYVARVDGETQACAAMLIQGDLAEFGIAATLEPARGRGCQRALLHRRILDAAGAGCRTLFVETGERVPDRPSASYKNILRAGFEEAYLRPNWTRPG